MKNAVVFLTVLLTFAGCASTHNMFGGGSKPQVASPKEMPETAKDEFNKGMTAYENEQYVSAEQHFENVVRIDNTIPEAHLNLALSLYQQSKTDQANKHFDEAKRLYSDEIGRGSRARGVRPMPSDSGTSPSDPSSSR
ncbi:MAG: hypothetical protein HY282_06770 [Nitrospirae bacterium]|nr:hypothetical protein [Candidatus Manganitrophaceae bacterium]